MMWEDFIKEIKEDIKTYKSLGWRGVVFYASLLWSFIWMMAVDSEDSTAFILSIVFMLLGFLGAGLSFLSLYLEDLKK